MLPCLLLSAALIGQAPAPPDTSTSEAPPPKLPPAPSPPPDRWLLMKALQGTWPGAVLDSNRTQVYGWVQQGFAANPASPRDRINFGANEDWRSNDYRLNQVYFVLENPLEHESRPNLGYRVDFLVGNDAPFFVANGLFSSFTGFDATSGVGVAGPQRFRQVNRIGMDLPQFYLEGHIPHVLTEKGLDIRVGKFYTLMGREVYPGADTDFYSRTYENIYATPFTHTGVLATVHATRQLDVVAGVVRGWDVFEDNNSSPSYHGAFVWTSPDKRYSWTTAWITGPEQPHNNRDYRTLVSSYVTVKFDSSSRLVLVTGGHYGFEENAAVDPVRGARKDADWYAYSAHLFYTVTPQLRLGMRAEWFRDDEGTRTAQLKRPGFAASFYDLTLGVTYKPYRSLQIRPEVRWDWSPDARPYNDQTDKSQFTAAFDVIWRF
ncbi:MAG: porin [Planctomycetes bacterium]|nr:porin [Planctomycetota bacterium]